MQSLFVLLEFFVYCAKDDEIGDGTTGVVVFAGALLEQAESLLDKGIHPSKSLLMKLIFSHSLFLVRVAQGFDLACQIALQHMNTIAEKVEFTKDNVEALVQTATTCLGSKMYFTRNFLSNS